MNVIRDFELLRKLYDGVFLSDVELYRLSKLMKHLNMEFERLNNE